VTGPDLPPPDQPFTADAYRHRWPTAVMSTALVDGVLWFEGDYDHRDVETARRTFPDRHVTLDVDGGLLVEPSRPPVAG
jgi:hypothetical protein